MGLLSYGSMDRRFFGALGASLLDRTICASAGAAGLKATVGKPSGFDPEAVVHARFIVAWGANIVSSNVHLWPFIEEARRRGAKLVVVDPYRSRTAEKADQHLALLPGTDAALALGMMHVIFRDGLEDRDYIERYTSASSSCASARAEWTPARAAADHRPRPRPRSRRFAREYATTQPSAIRSTTASTATPARAWPCAPSPACPRSTGAWRHAGRRRAALDLGHLPGGQRGPGAARPRARRARAR